MKAYILSDGEYETQTLHRLYALVKRVLEQKGFSVTEKQLQKNELAFCKGCFGCWIKTPGECVIKDAMAGINRETMASDVVIYLIPIVFGQVFRQYQVGARPLDSQCSAVFSSRPKPAQPCTRRGYERNPQYVMLAMATR